MSATARRHGGPPTMTQVLSNSPKASHDMVVLMVALQTAGKIIASKVGANEPVNHFVMQSSFTSIIQIWRLRYDCVNGSLIGHDRLSSFYTPQIARAGIEGLYGMAESTGQGGDRDSQKQLDVVSVSVNIMLSHPAEFPLTGGDGVVDLCSYLPSLKPASCPRTPLNHTRPLLRYLCTSDYRTR